MFLYAIEKLEIESQQLLHVGDKVNIDVLGANKAGCRSIWFNPEQEEAVKHDADATINNLSELLAFDFF